MERLDLYCKTAWLHRHKRPTWKFEYDPTYRKLTYITSRRTVYTICPDLSVGIAFWIARRFVNAAGADVWITSERELRARYIEFEDGGLYLFPGHKLF